MRFIKIHTAVLLLDEIEKAHPDVFNLLLQIMDHGALTDNNNASQTLEMSLLCRTTNIGAESISRACYWILQSKTIVRTTKHVNKIRYEDIERGYRTIDYMDMNKVYRSDEYESNVKDGAIEDGGINIYGQFTHKRC